MISSFINISFPLGVMDYDFQLLDKLNVSLCIVIIFNLSSSYILDSNAIETSTAPVVTEEAGGADETSEVAAAACDSEQFRCGSGECVPLTWRCDGRADCADESDESTHCRHRNATCTAEQWACGAWNVCVPLRARCDGAADCPRAEDERGCACPPGAARCADTALCLHPVRAAL